MKLDKIQTKKPCKELSLHIQFLPSSFPIIFLLCATQATLKLFSIKIVSHNIIIDFWTLDHSNTRYIDVITWYKHRMASKLCIYQLRLLPYFKYGGQPCSQKEMLKRFNVLYLALFYSTWCKILYYFVVITCGSNNWTSAVLLIFALDKYFNMNNSSQHKNDTQHYTSV